MSRTLSLPTPSTYVSHPTEAVSKLSNPHIRAQLGTIHRQYKPLENFESETDDDSSRVSPLFVQKVVDYLDEEREDELKALLKDTYGMDEDAVSIHTHA